MEHPSTVMKRRDWTGIWDALVRDGYVVIPNVLSPEECDHTLGLLRQETCKAYGIVDDKLDKALPSIMWRNQKVATLQQRGMWELRTHPHIIDVYQQFWHHHLDTSTLEGMGVDNPHELPLVCSLDGFMIAPPTYKKESEPWVSTDKGWLHSDQSSTRRPQERELELFQTCVQGQILLEDSMPGDPGFTCLKGSHLLWDDLCKHPEFGHRISATRDWTMMSGDMYTWYKEHGCQHIKVPCPRGGMILWYSCTIHAGSNASVDQTPIVPLNQGGKKKKGGNVAYRGRATTFVSMTPQWWCEATDWGRRRDAFAQSRGTNHWTFGRGMRVNPLKPMGAANLLKPKDIQPPFEFAEGTRERAWQDHFLNGTPISEEHRNRAASTDVPLGH